MSLATVSRELTMFSLLRIPLFLLLIAIGPAPASADEERKGTLHPLVIQADFAGLVMTGVAYSVNPALTVHNVRPLIPLYDIAAASASLAYNAQTWPAGSVFVSVVDPGVGTERKSVVLKTRNGLYFVSPDNGSLSGPAELCGIDAVREIDEAVNRRPGTQWSHTFHGRDVYAYTGARLAAGVIEFEGVGPLLPARVMTLDMPAGSYSNGVFDGQVAGGVGRLGNIYFNIDRALFEQDSPDYGDRYRVEIRRGQDTVWSGSVPYVRSFGAVPVGDNLLFINSSGDLAIAINQGNFAETHGIGYGVSWTVRIEREASASEIVDTLVRSRGIDVPVTWTRPVLVGAPGPVPLAVLIHGHGGNRHEAGGFTRVARKLAERGIASIRMDFAGSGDSSEGFRHNNLVSMQADVLAAQRFAIDTGHVDAARIALVGFSMGGRVAALLSAEQDAAYPAMVMWAPAVLNGPADMVDRVGGQEAWERMKTVAATQGYAPFETFWGQQQELGARWFSDMETSRPLDAIAAYPGALLLLHGAADDVVDPAVSQEAVKAAASARSATLQMIEGADHGFGLFSDPDPYSAPLVAATVSFLEEQLLSRRNANAPSGAAKTRSEHE